MALGEFSAQTFIIQDDDFPIYYQLPSCDYRNTKGSMEHVESIASIRKMSILPSVDQK
jgi:hypothetical protein